MQRATGEYQSEQLRARMLCRQFILSHTPERRSFLLAFRQNHARAATFPTSAFVTQHRPQFTHDAGQVALGSHDCANVFVR